METTTFAVLAKSGVHLGYCLLGYGATKKEAMEDAFGPKPWSPYVKKRAREVNVTELAPDDLDAYLNNPE